MGISFTKYLRIVTYALILTTFFLFINRPDVASAGYDGSRLIDNSVFLDAKSMNPQEIQSFLVSKSSGLANRTFLFDCFGPDSVERQWYTAAGAPCDQTVLSSQIIYYAAQIYGINPRVVLATLQKEQGLITNPNPTQTMLNQAMGYACPTTGSCDPNSRFFWQIDMGTWNLRFHYERARGNLSWWQVQNSWVCGNKTNDADYTLYRPGLVPGQSVTFYDGAGYLRGGVAYRTYTLANAATAALYCYTPHAYNNPQGLYGRAPYGTAGEYYSGSLNFVTSYEAWFGDTTRNLVSSNGGTYLIQNGQKRPFPNEETFYSYSYKWSDVLAISPAELALIPSGTTMPYNIAYREGRLISSPGKGVYLVDTGVKRPIASEIAFLSYSYKWSDVLMISPTELSLIPDGSLMNYNAAFRNGKLVTSPSIGIYLIEGGVKRPFPSADVFLSYSYKWSDVLTLAPTELALIPDGGAVTLNVSALNGQLATSNGNGVYLIESGLKRAIPDSETFLSYAYSWNKVKHIAAIDFTSIPDGLPLSYNVHFRDNKLVGYGGGVYLVENGVKRPFPSADVFLSYSYKWSDVIQLSSVESSYIPDGTVMPVKS